MNRTGIGKWTWAVGAMGLALAVSFCASQQQQANTRSAALVEQLKKQNIPGLPATLTDEQAMDIERGRSGAGAWFVERGCFACHSVSVYGVKGYSQMGPDLSTAVEDVKSRFGKNLDEFWKEPMGTMLMVRSQLIKLSPEEEALSLQKLKTAYADYQNQKAEGQAKK
jgi:hypothetical protein